MESDVFALVGVAALIIVAPLVLLNWKLAWAAYIFTLCCNGLVFQIGPIAIRPEHFGLLLLVVIAVKTHSQSSRNGGAAPLAFWLLIGVWVSLGCIANAFVAPEPAASFYILSWIISSLAAFALVSRSAHKAQMINIGTYVIGAVSVASVASWILSEATRQALPLTILDNGDGLARIVGFAFEPNIMGALLVTWIALALYWKHDLTRASLILVPIISVASILTMTRAAWASLVLILLINLAYAQRNRLGKVLLLLIAAAVVAFSLVSSTDGAGAVVGKINSFFDFGSGTGAFRSLSWRIAIEDIQMLESWFSGLGTNSFVQRHADLVDSARIDYLSNAWIAQLYDTGVLGLVALIAAFIVLWLTSTRRPAAFPLFASIALTSALTNNLWFAFPWAFMALIDQTPQYASQPTIENPARLSASHAALTGERFASIGASKR